MTRRSAAVSTVPSVVSPVLNVTQACIYLGCGRTYLTQHADEIGVIRAGGKLRFLREDLDCWILRHRTQTATPIETTHREPTPITRGLDTSKLGPINPATRKPWGATMHEARP